MGRSFITPEERQVLASLPPGEAAFVRELMDTFDAHLVPDGSEPWRFRGSKPKRVFGERDAA